MYFDTHAHYYDDQFDADRDLLLSSMKENGVSNIVIPASDLVSAKMSRDIAEKYGFIYFAAGFHPHDAKDADSGAMAEIEELLGHEKCVAVGEIGLDYHYDFSPRDVQKAVFRRQLELAREKKLPVIVHEREAVRDTLDIISDFRDIRGVVHCFSGSWETAEAILRLGWSISFTGIVTFKNARKSLEAAAKMPLERLMLETDSPYMAPVPFRGTRNSSLNLPYIAEKIAQLRDMPVKELAQITAENGRRFFNINR